MTENLAAGLLHNMARQAWREFHFAPASHRYSRAISGPVMVEVDRQQRVMVAVLTSTGQEIITSDFSEAVEALTQ